MIFFNPVFNTSAKIERLNPYPFTVSSKPDTVDFVDNTVDFVARMSNVLSTLSPVCTGPTRNKCAAVPQFALRDSE